jgi:hypothetical protein
MTRRSLRVLLAAAVVVISGLTTPQSAAAQALTLTGYADFEALFENVNSDNSKFYFDNHHVNFIAVGKITGDLFAAAEVEYEHAGEEVALEYGYLGFTGIKDVRIIAGKFIVPFGRFNKDLHPTPVNKLPGRPLGFSEILPQTYNDVGLWVNGAKALNDDNRFVFDLFMVNGLLGGDGDGIRSLRDNDREKAEFGSDDNKAVGGRIGLEFPFVGFDIGGSVYTGKYAQDAADNSLNLTLVGVDASFQKEGFVLRGELVRASQEATGGKLTKTGGYLQASYMATPRFEPVVRFSARDMPSESSDASRLGIGLNYHIAAAGIVRVAYLLNMEKETFKKDNNGIVTQFTVFF